MSKNFKIHTLDLNFLDKDSSIAAYLIESSDELVLIETGPETTFNYLVKAIENKGFDWRNIKHVLLSHIHFDHAGAAWKFAENGAKIYVHPIGLPHLQNPERLWNSAKMIYKEDMERLWGEMKPIDEKLLVPADEGDCLSIGDLEFNVHYTPGHAIHHNAYQLEDIIFTGDVAGVRINLQPVVPPCPPPDIDLGKWKSSIDKMRKLNPQSLYLTHFGKVDKTLEHLDELEWMLDDWANWMKPYYDKGIDPDEITPKFIEYTKNQLLEKGVNEDDVLRYEYANPSWMSVVGLLRYWRLKDEGRI